jgi:hypothetical protein
MLEVGDTIVPFLTTICTDNASLLPTGVVLDYGYECIPSCASVWNTRLP